MAERGDYKSLVEKDQLLRVIADPQGAVFEGFRETPPLFHPSYRMLKDSKGFSNKREQPPSYTDRILWHSSPNARLPLPAPAEVSRNATLERRTIAAGDVDAMEHMKMAAAAVRKGRRELNLAGRAGGNDAGGKEEGGEGDEAEEGSKLSPSARRQKERETGVDCNGMPNVELTGLCGIIQQAYASKQRFLGSDHRPVTAVFSVWVRRPYHPAPTPSCVDPDRFFISYGNLSIAAYVAPIIVLQVCFSFSFSSR